MPRVRRRSKTRRAGVTKHHIDLLLSGCAYCGHADPVQGTDDESLRALWADMRDELLPTFVAEHPGERPHAWWRWDAPARRENMSGVHPFDDPKRKAMIAETLKRPNVAPGYEEIMHELHWGMPRALVAESCFNAEYETEWHYLRRLGLLEPSEVAALGV